MQIRVWVRLRFGHISVLQVLTGPQNGVCQKEREGEKRERERECVYFYVCTPSVHGTVLRTEVRAAGLPSGYQ